MQSADAPRVTVSDKPRKPFKLSWKYLVTVAVLILAGGGGYEFRSYSRPTNVTCYWKQIGPTAERTYHANIYVHLYALVTTYNGAFCGQWHAHTDVWIPPYTAAGSLFTELLSSTGSTVGTPATGGSWVERSADSYSYPQYATTCDSAYGEYRTSAYSNGTQTAKQCV